MYEVVFKKSVEDDLKKIDRQHWEKIFKAVESLALNPRSHKTKKLFGYEDLYRLKVGVYRVVYQLDDEKGRIVVYSIRHRKDAYR